LGGIHLQSISLREVDGVHVTTLMDNSSDVLLPDEGGLVRRWGLNGSAGPLPVIPDGMAVDGHSVDFLRLRGADEYQRVHS
jgi:7,8-dihydropterin-6-yl-methyl-4-(beta-D-ribofuranosyl)aminobenzene 5'-phosphate synthase